MFVFTETLESICTFDWLIFTSMAGLLVYFLLISLELLSLEIICLILSILFDIGSGSGFGGLHVLRIVGAWIE